MNQKLIKKIDKYIEKNYVTNECFEGAILSSMTFDHFVLEDSFTTTLLRIIDEKGLTDSEVYNKSLVDRRVFSKIRSNVDYKPNKNTVIALCIGLGLNIDDTEDLLDRSGYTLSKSNKRDVIIRYFFENEKDFNVEEVDETLTYYNLDTIIRY